MGRYAVVCAAIGAADIRVTIAGIRGRNTRGRIRGRPATHIALPNMATCHTYIGQPHRPGAPPQGHCDISRRSRERRGDQRRSEALSSVLGRSGALWGALGRSRAFWGALRRSVALQGRSGAIPRALGRYAARALPCCSLGPLFRARARVTARSALRLRAPPEASLTPPRASGSFSDTPGRPPEAALTPRGASGGVSDAPARLRRRLRRPGAPPEAFFDAPGRLRSSPGRYTYESKS